MKKLKWILLFIMFFLAIVFLFATCKKTKALESELYSQPIVISSIDQSDYNVVFIFNYSNTNLTNFNFLDIGNDIYLNMVKTNGGGLTLRIASYNLGVLESYNLNSDILDLRLVEDTGSLYLIVYQVFYTVQHNQGQSTVIDGVERSMITRFNLGNYSCGQAWENTYLTLNFLFSSIPYYMANWSYIDYSETPQDVNNWVNNNLYSILSLNALSEMSYDYGYDDGYDDGYDNGEDAGYDTGYDAGYDAGEDAGYFTGRTEGLAEGEQIGYSQGYNVGYSDGQAGNTAITPVFNTLSGIFSVIGSVLAIELVPHVPLGIFFLVPLFFSAVGLILWIWRRN